MISRILKTHAKVLSKSASYGLFTLSKGHVMLKLLLIRVSLNLNGLKQSLHFTAPQNMENTYLLGAIDQECFT